MTNNKESMKLYPEEQLRASMLSMITYIKMYDESVIDKIVENHIRALGGVELPSDEEIGKLRDEHIPIDEENMWSERLYFTIGAKSMRDKIGGNNGNNNSN